MVDPTWLFHQIYFYQQMGHLHDYNVEILDRKCSRQKALANVQVHSHYILAYLLLQARLLYLWVHQAYVCSYARL